MELPASRPPLAAAAWVGDAAAKADAGPVEFDAIYRAYAPLVRRTAWSLGGAQDLDDIVQETFLRLWRSWDGFRGESQRRTWVYTVTLNTARSHWRGRGRLKAAFKRFLMLVPRTEAVAGGQDAWELDAGLARALRRLDARQREALTLVHLEGLSLAEAAAAMGVPEGTVKSRLFQARSRMQALLQEADHGNP